jgi:hypothetical protein
MLIGSDAVTLDVAIIPSTGSMVISGAAPTVSHLISVGTGTVTISSDAVTLGQTANPTTGSAVISGQQPVVNHLVSAGTGSLAISSDVNIVIRTQSVAPSTGSMVIAGQAIAKAEEDHVIEVGVGSLSISSDAVTLGGTANPTTRSAVISGETPVRLLNHIVAPATVSMAIVGQSIAKAEEDHVISIGVGSIAVVGQSVPLLLRQPPLATVALSGQAIALVQVANAGVSITNPNASTSEISNYEQCDLTGFRQLPGSMRLTWNKYAVRRKSYDERHPSTMQQSGHTDRQSGPKRPEQEDRFLEVNEVTADDL